MQQVGRFPPYIIGGFTMKQVAEYINTIYGIAGRVFETDMGYTVALYDIDAGETVNHYYRFNSLAQAVVKAKHIANVQF